MFGLGTDIDGLVKGPKPGGTQNSVVYDASFPPSGVTGAELVDNHLFRSADYFWHMWEQCEAQKVNVH